MTTIRVTLSNAPGKPFLEIEGAGSGPLRVGDTGSPFTDEEKVVVERLIERLGDPRELFPRDRVVATQGDTE